MSETTEYQGYVDDPRSESEIAAAFRANHNFFRGMQRRRELVSYRQLVYMPRAKRIQYATNVGFRAPELDPVTALDIAVTLYARFYPDRVEHQKRNRKRWQRQPVAP